MGIANYCKEFTMLVKMAEKCGTDYSTTVKKKWSSQQLHKVKFASLNAAQKKEVTKDLKEGYLVIIFILSANKNKIFKIQT